MGSVAIDMTMSLDGYVAGPDDRPGQELGAHGGAHIFDWYTSGPKLPGDLEIAHPEPGANRDEVQRLIAESGAFIFGRRTYDLTNGWGGSHPIDGMPLFILTHNPPPASEVPQGRSRITFVTDGIASAVRQARAAAGDKQVKLQGASPGKQALVAGSGRRAHHPPRAVPSRRRRAAVRYAAGRDPAGEAECHGWAVGDTSEVSGGAGVRALRLLAVHFSFLHCIPSSATSRFLPGALHGAY